MINVDSIISLPELWDFYKTEPGSGDRIKARHISGIMETEGFDIYQAQVIYDMRIHVFHLWEMAAGWAPFEDAKAAVPEFLESAETINDATNRLIEAWHGK
jgi:hypothetical protein